MAGFLAGILAILGNPKAVLFYIGVLPGFFDLRTVTAVDVLLILGVSVLIPLVGNLVMAAFVGRVRALITTSGALQRINTGAGVLLILVGLLLPFT
ncbi:LysE family transporter [Photobacterium sp. TY 1-4]|uniref:LysE family transporter n=1 Tax=Pseudosulfitobacter koreensis TaxID=2968472 RepID=A0ABT1YWZ0_9RHOB|nr:LysE family transporter [Pseudosulfitobacter koreense]